MKIVAIAALSAIALLTCVRHDPGAAGREGRSTRRSRDGGRTAGGDGRRRRPARHTCRRPKSRPRNA